MDPFLVAAIFVEALLLLVASGARPSSRIHRRGWRSSSIPTDPWQLFNISIRTNNNRTQGLFPSVFNLASMAEISSNATCGENGSEQFCKLVEHVKRRPGDQIQCGICLGSATVPTGQGDAHPIGNAIDGTHRWWQSPTIANGWNYNWVTITLDLKQIYQVAYVIVKAANSPRPGNWILERSTDGIHFRPWQYFALTNSDCWNTYGVQPTTGVPRFKRDDDVICTAAFSKLDPLENGEIHISLVNGRPGVEGPSQELIEFTRARFIRLRLQRVRTLNADLMLPFHSDLKYLDPTVTNRYYYSIKDISVGGQCICYGHARSCPIDPSTRELRCQCEDNTCGRNCEVCCPLFNQVPWRQGTYRHGAVCQECNCFGHADSCVYNATVADQRLSLNTDGLYEGGGVCIGCKHHTMGINCEMCDDGYYRPSGLDHNQPEVCQPCLCHGVGTTGMCIKDDASEDLGLNAGDCICREGYCGPECDQCVSGYTGFPYCVRCPCSAIGSTNDDLCTQCICKTNVCGVNCDACCPGHYNLRAEDPVGCQSCFCFSITNVCHSSPWGRHKVKAREGWVMTDQAGTGSVLPDRTPDGSLHLSMQKTYHLNRDLYWVAPYSYSGNKVLSYGGTFTYSFHYSVNCSAVENDPESHLGNHDIIIEGSGARLGLGGRYFEEEVEHVVSINLTEEGWVHLDGSSAKPGSMVSREEFMVLLAEVERLLVRASYNVHQTEMTLLEVGLDVAAEDGVGPQMAAVEMCVCPEGYAGTSCETCAPGYRRMGNMLVGGSCQLCQCNKHSDVCDPYTGECKDCQHNTRGFHCEICAIGYHGDAGLGYQDSCQPCACPLATRSFAESCEVVRDDRGKEEHVCLHCSPGHSGRYCEICIQGYYGNPLLTGNYCQPCNCHGNAANIGECDPFSGRCYSCAGHTEGDRCDRCQEGYYGNAIHGNCSKCQCSYHGSVSDACDRVSGQCQCRAHYVGRNCEQCQSGYGQAASGCHRCNCNPIGSLTGTLCDPVTGQCHCREGVTGPQCSECLPGYYDFSTAGCQVCSCHPFGSASSSCDILTGRCQCHDNVLGWLCDHCRDDYWGLNSGLGCQPCHCNTTGSSSSQCDVDSGACPCRHGVSGQKCDGCLPGYYRFGYGGCRKCENCEKPGHICDADTGRCVCPPNTEGEHCQRCRTNSWGYDPIQGCQVCGCSPIGSSSSQCDPVNGQCRCSGDYTGQRCDHCPFGQFGFPSCIPCKCDERGTQADQCKNGQCTCHTTTGQCLCKENVSGRNCDGCKDGAFGLDADDLLGCTSCFCFGRSQRCTQAPYIWSQVTVPSQAVKVHVNVEMTLEPTLTGSLVVPDDAFSVRIDERHSLLPLFLNLTKFTQGDRTLSYKGYFRFKLTLRTASPKSTLIAVHLQGNDQIHLVHNFMKTYRTHRQDFQVLLREDQWVDDLGRPVTRGQMMIALQNVQHWLIQLTQKSGSIQGVELVDTSFDEAIPSNPLATDAAYGIESCVCPKPFSGLSCQDPIDGFFRRRPDAVDIVVDPIDLIGVVEPCQCHGRSRTCDKETGRCLNCVENTGGDHCDICRVGFYNTLQGNSGALQCRPCGCPSVEPTKNFSPSCIPSAQLNGYVCNACQKGYTGQKCERCAAGFYGNPMAVGGCQPCFCHVTGSRDDHCNPVTGQCSCHEGIAGRTCDTCQPNYTIVDGSCRSCDEGCTGELMSTLQGIMNSMDAFNTTAAALLPWAKLIRMENTTNHLQKSLKSLTASDVKEVAEDMPSLKIEAERLMHKAEELNIIAETEEEVAADTRLEASELSQTIQEVYDYIVDTVAELGQPASGGQLNGPDIGQKYKESEDLLQVIKSIDFTKTVKRAEEEFRLAETLLKEVQEVVSVRDDGIVTVRQRDEEVRSRLEDLKNVTSGLQQQLTNTSAVNIELRKLLEKIKADNREIRERFASATASCQKASQTNEMASHFLWNVTNENYQEGTDLLQEIRRKNDELLSMNRELRQGLTSVDGIVKEAARHADRLKDQSDQLEQRFSGTRHSAENPLRAATAYEDTKNAIEEAEESATKAEQAANEALEEILLNAVPDRTRESLLKSEQLNASAAELLVKISDQIGPKVKKTIEELQGTSRNVQDIKTMMTEFDTMLNMTPTGLKEAVHEISYKTALSLGKSNNIEKNMSKKLDHLQSELLPKLEEIKSFRIDELNTLNVSVVLANSQVDELINRSQALYERRDRIQRIGLDIGQSILKLRRMIEEARAQADSIKISLYHHGQCVRRYAVPDRSSLVNSITLHFKTNASDVDQLLFLLRSRNNSNYLAIEMVDRRIRFLWNIGDGTALVEHDEEIESFVGKAEERDMWYRIHAERIGNVGRLNVHKLSSPVDPDLEAKASSPPGFMRLDLGDDTDLFVAGVPSDLKRPEELMSSLFDGCVGAVQMDGQSLGLYNFRQLVQGLDCRGCFTVPIVEESSSVVYQFSGRGYASVPQVRYSPERLSITFQFKSFWKDAILFYTANNKTGDFVSLELINGRVFFRFGFMGKSEATLTTQLTYNTNDWTQVRASRTRLEGILEVEKERITGASPDVGVHTMDLAYVSLFFAGIPADVPTDVHNSTRLGFLGCLRDVMVASRGTYTQDFVEGIYVGMSLGCHAKANVVGFPGLGHLELGSPNIPEEGGVAVSFRTQQEDALILLAVGTKPNHFYSLSIVGGRMSAWLNAGSGLTQITTELTYNDGLMHSVAIHKDHGLVELFIDNQLVGTAQLPPNSLTIGSMRGAEGGLYIGGIPFGMSGDGMAASLFPFRGCLVDLLVNELAMPFDLPVAFDMVDIGRCVDSDLFMNIHEDPSQMKRSTTPTIPSFTVTVTVPVAVPVAPVTTLATTETTKRVIPTKKPQPTEPTTCAEEGDFSYVSNAVSFGDIRHSHTEIELEKLDARMFNVSMSVNTYYDKGQLFYIGSRNRLDFLALSLRHGVATVVYRGSGGGVETLSSGVAIGDGLWHNLELTKTSTSIILQIDETEAVSSNTSQQIVALSPIYIGGLPKDHPTHSAVVNESLKGCLRNFEVNGQLIDVANSKVIMGVRQCFSRSEPGVHFDGYGYAIFAERYRIASDLSLSFEFRTTRQNGVIISISHPTGMPALALEMVDGRIKFTAVNIDNIYSTESETCAHCLCDDRWHSVRADLIRNLVTLKVDSGKLTVSVGAGSDMLLETNHELYIGGFPVYAIPQGATHTSEFFEGCLRNVRINNTLVDWHAMDTLIDVHVSGCPQSEA